MQMLLPTLPLYLLKIGGSHRDIGYVMGSYTIGAMLMRAAAGWLVDRYGRKKILIAGIAAMLATTLLYGLAKDVLILTAIRVLHGMTFGLIGTAVGAMVVDGLPPARISEGIGYFGLTATLSMAVAPMLGLWLTGAFGYTVLFAAVSALVALTLLYSLFVKDTHTGVVAPSCSIAATLTSLLEKTALLPSVVAFFLTSVYGAVLFFIALHAADIGIGNAGLFFLAMALSMLLFRPISGRWADRGGTDAVMLIGHLALAAGIVLIGLCQGIGTYLLAGVLAGVGFGFCFPTLQALAVRYATTQRRGAATGTFFLAFDVGIGLGAILWGYVAEEAGYRIMYYITLVPLAVAGAIYYRFRARMGKKK